MKKKVIIIGGGIAGLSAGCYLRMNGFKTRIFEQHHHPGGLCTSWKRGDYTFDGCVHWLAGSSPDDPFHKLWNEDGGEQAQGTLWHKGLFQGSKNLQAIYERIQEMGKGTMPIMWFQPQMGTAPFLSCSGGNTSQKNSGSCMTREGFSLHW